MVEQGIYAPLNSSYASPLQKGRNMAKSFRPQRKDGATRQL